MFTNFLIFSDASYAYQLGFQDIGSSSMSAIVTLHDNICIYLVIILIFVVWMLFASIRYQWILSSKIDNLMYYIIRIVWVGERLKHCQILEVIWTFIPCFVLLSIGMPSFSILYIVSNPISTSIYNTVKVTGHQWFWSYEYLIKDGSDDVVFWGYDSYLKGLDDLSIGDFRLLEVNNPLYLVKSKMARLLVTSSDVLHSFAVPSLGLKIDAVPGRLNQVFVYPIRFGSFYGQCSELCGVDHGFMPINVKVTNFRLDSKFF